MRQIEERDKLTIFWPPCTVANIHCCPAAAETQTVSGWTHRMLLITSAWFLIWLCVLLFFFFFCSIAIKLSSRIKSFQYGVVISESLHSFIVYSKLLSRQYEGHVSSFVILRTKESKVWIQHLALDLDYPRLTFIQVLSSGSKTYTVHWSWD